MSFPLIAPCTFSTSWSSSHLLLSNLHHPHYQTKRVFNCISRSEIYCIILTLCLLNRFIKLPVRVTVTPQRAEFGDGWTSADVTGRWSRCFRVPAFKPHFCHLNSFISFFFWCGHGVVPAYMIRIQQEVTLFCRPFELIAEFFIIQFVGSIAKLRF